MRAFSIVIMLLIVSVLWADCGSYDNSNSSNLNNSNRAANVNSGAGSNENSARRVESAKPSPSVSNAAATPQPSRRVMPARELGNDAPPVRNDNEREQGSNNSARSPL